MEKPCLPMVALIIVLATVALMIVLVLYKHGHSVYPAWDYRQYWSCAASWGIVCDPVWNSMFYSDSF